MNKNEKFIQIDSNEEFEDFKQGARYILYFSSENCNVCHSVFPRLLELNSNTDIPIGRIDVDKNIEIAGQNLVFTIPTILIFNENTELLRESRFIDFLKIEKLLSVLNDGI